MTLDELISRTLLLDIETTKSGRIRHIGAVFNDHVVETSVEATVKQTLSQVEDLSSIAEFVLGHNLLGHDFPVLQSTYPRLEILKKAGYRHALSVTACVPSKPLPPAC